MNKELHHCSRCGNYTRHQNQITATKKETWLCDWCFISFLFDVANREKYFISKDCRRLEEFGVMIE